MGFGDDWERKGGQLGLDAGEAAGEAEVTTSAGMTARRSRDSEMPCGSGRWASQEGLLCERAVVATATSRGETGALSRLEKEKRTVEHRRIHENGIREERNRNP